MVNLTEQAGIVSEGKGLHPVPDHDLVVFRKVGGGLEFREIVPPNRNFKPKLFESAGSFVAYTVSKDDSLRHIFLRNFDYKDQTRSFTLRFATTYQIANPLRLVEKLPTDPLLRIEQELGELVRVALRPLDWSVIVEENGELEQATLYQPLPDGTGTMLTNIERIRQFARKLGVEIRSVSLSRILPDEELRVAKAKKKVYENQEIERATHDYRVQLVEHKHEVTGLDDGQKVRSTVATATANVITRAAGEIRTFSEARQTLPEIHAIKAGIQGLTGTEPRPDGAHGQGALPQASVPQLPALCPASGALADLLLKTLRLVDGITCEEQTKRWVTAIALHLIAEGLRGGEAEAAIVQKYTDALGQEMRKLFRELTDDQTQFLRYLQDTTTLKRELE